MNANVNVNELCRLCCVVVYIIAPEDVFDPEHIEILAEHATTRRQNHLHPYRMFKTDI
jgi:hypothetical protein